MRRGVISRTSNTRLLRQPAAARALKMFIPSGPGPPGPPYQVQRPSCHPSMAPSSRRWRTMTEPLCGGVGGAPGGPAKCGGGATGEMSSSSGDAGAVMRSSGDARSAATEEVVAASSAATATAPETREAMTQLVNTGALSHAQRGKRQARREQEGKARAGCDAFMRHAESARSAREGDVAHARGSWKRPTVAIRAPRPGGARAPPEQAGCWPLIGQHAARPRRPLRVAAAQGARRAARQVGAAETRRWARAEAGRRRAADRWAVQSRAAVLRVAGRRRGAPELTAAPAGSATGSGGREEVWADRLAAPEARCMRELGCRGPHSSRPSAKSGRR